MEINCDTSPHLQLPKNNNFSSEIPAPLDPGGAVEAGSEDSVNWTDGLCHSAHCTTAEVSLARLCKTGEWAGEGRLSAGESMPYHRKNTSGQTFTITIRHPAATDVNVTLPPYSVWIEVTENTLGKRIAAVSALCPRQQHLHIPTEEPEGAIMAINQTE